MKHIIIGTAGHIDHGKTTLIRALTGRNTDRLKEEQKRGITIDLGFTWIDLSDGTRAGIIDVPGHEKFIGNMVAGIVGMDLVLMVIAADEGVMPQTREHLDILSLLGVEKCILVLNKCDLVDEEWLQMVEEETAARMKGTILEHAPVVKVSAATGEGIEELKELILKMTRDEVVSRDTETIPRLPIDRVFTMAGFGTVITGTLISGTIRKEDVLELYPVGKECRIRGIQVHGKEQDACEAGQRVAINLSNIKKEEIHRGCVIAPKNSMKNTERIDVTLQCLKDSERILTNRERLHLYTGTSEVLCRAVLLDKEEIDPGEQGLAQLILEEPLAVRKGDRFVVRFYSPLETIGGGVVLEPNPQKKKRFQEDALDELRRKESGSLADICELHIREHGDTMLTLAELAKTMSHSAEELMPHLENLVSDGLILRFPMKKDTFYWHRESEFLVRQDISRDMKRYHEKYPYRHGMKTAEVHMSYMKRIKRNVFDAYILYAVENGYFKTVNEFLALSDFEIVKDEHYLEIEKLLTDAMEQAGYELLRFSEIERGKISEQEAIDVTLLLMEEERVVRINEEMFTMKHFMDAAKEKIEQHFETEDLITIAQVRDMFSTNRKSAKPILEYMDELHVTKKVGAETERVRYV
ncbi:MAG: selenocysteine-specific translation elongation factor [Lachnospiraceae bacterium]|nr:selenocysteine-specific translation elongation factor [Lachnospiraceae bacterium]